MQNVPEPVRALLAAIVDALDVPIADQLADDPTATALLRQRASDVRIIAESALRSPDPRNIEGAAAQLHRWTTECPVTYRSWQQRTAQAAAEEQQLLAEPVDEQEAARHSVDRAFPAVAAFLTEDGEGQ